MTHACTTFRIFESGREHCADCGAQPIDQALIDAASDWCSVNEPDADEARVLEVAREIEEAERDELARLRALEGRT